MSLEHLVGLARERGASDLHLEGGLPAAIRVQGQLQRVGEPVSPRELTRMARELLPEARWREFLERGSADLSLVVGGGRCRLNVLRSARGVGMAVRLFSSFQATLHTLNLHPCLADFVTHRHGLILISGPTGCGKSSTLAALVQQVNHSQARHVITLESPIEYSISPRQALIRQREVGRDTPSFQQGLLDALREDPDLLVVGEMREPETMRLTLSAAETGHLVLASLHSATVQEALQRIVAAFPAEIQPGVCAQLADVLVAVVCQELHYHPEEGINLPQLEILRATTPVRSVIRQGAFVKLQTVMESGAAEGQWPRARYLAWMSEQQRWFVPGQGSQFIADESEQFVHEPGANEELRSASPDKRAYKQSVPVDADAPERGVFVLDDQHPDPAAVLGELLED